MGMKLVNIDVDRVNNCVMENKTRYLQTERANQAWSSRALRINGWRYTGMMDAELATKAICSAFRRQPEECKGLTKERNPFVTPQTSGLKLQELVAWLLGLCVMMGVCMVAYKRYLKKEMRATLREEVML